LSLWKNWLVRSDITHGGTSFSIEGSVKLIESMLNNLSIQQSDVFLENVKGKHIISESNKTKELATNEIA
jgi:hypothetical protein